MLYDGLKNGLFYPKIFPAFSRGKWKVREFSQSIHYQWKTCLIVFSLPSPCSSTLERRVSKGIFTFFTLTCQPPLFSFFLGNLQGSQKIFQTGVWSGLFGFGQYGNYCGFLHIERHTRRRGKSNYCTIIFSFAYKAHINNFVEIGHSIYCRGISISEGSAEYLQLESGFYSKTFYQRYLRKVIEYL